jgi:hypothetical protein
MTISGNYTLNGLKLDFGEEEKLIGSKNNDKTNLVDWHS